MELEDDDGDPRHPGNVAANTAINAIRVLVVRVREGGRRDTNPHEYKARLCGQLSD